MSTHQQDSAGRWLRVSTGAQDETHQEPDIDRHIAASGYATGPTYRLHGASASKGKQDREFQRVLADMRAGRISVLVCWKLDRLDRRGILQSLRMVQDVRDAGGRVEFATEPQYNGDDAELNVAFGAHMARMESKIKSDRSKANHRDLRAGNYLVGQAPYGWLILPDGGHSTIAPDPATAPVVKRIFTDYASGATVAQIARALNAGGIASHRGASWSAETVAQVLRNRCHAGERLDARGRVVMTLPDQIVSTADFDAVAARLRARGTRKDRPSGDTAMLTGILRCAKCGGPMYRLTGFAGVVYYRCHGTNTERSTCRVMVPLALAESAVAAAVDDIAADAPEAFKITQTEQGRTVAQQTAEIDARLRALLPQLQDGDLDAAQFASQTATLAAERAAIAAAGDQGPTERVIGSAAEVAQHWQSLSPAGQRASLLDLGWQIRLTKDHARRQFTVSVADRRGQALAAVTMPATEAAAAA